MDLSTKALRRYRKRIGMIFQHFNLLQSLSVFDNIALPLRFAYQPKQLVAKKVGELLDLVDLTDRAHHYPSELSGGQKQRVAIARALATEPSILLCDEATSALDPESTATVLALLKKINKTLNITMVFITHELSVVKRVCDVVGVMEQGRLVETGAVLDVFANPKHDASRQLIYHQQHWDDPQKHGTNVVRLTFMGKSHNQPIVSSIAREFSVDANILQADIEPIDNKTVGTMLCQLTGEDHHIKQALAYLTDHHVSVEVCS